MTADFAAMSAHIDEFVTVARAMAEARMKTDCEIQFQVGTEPDPETDADVPVYETVFPTKCRVAPPRGQTRTAEVGGRTAAEVTRELCIPATSANPWADPRSAQGVTALVTAVHVTDDPTLLGSRLILVGPSPGSQTKERRLDVTEVVA